MAYRFPKMSAAQEAILAEICAVLGTHKANVPNRVVGLGIGSVCGRCLGSGEYSHCQAYGSTCFGCGGEKQSMPLPRDYAELLENAKAAVASGKLEHYLHYLNARKLMKVGTDKVMAAWKASAISGEYRWQEVANSVDPQVINASNANKLMCAAFDRIQKGSSELLFSKEKGAEYQAKVIAFAADVDAAVAEVEKAAADYWSWKNAK